MEEGGPSRTAEGEKKLIAVFVTGAVGYSPLMGDGHDAPAKTLAEIRGVFSSHIQRFEGRVVNVPGDSIREMQVDWIAAPSGSRERMDQPIRSGK